MGQLTAVAVEFDPAEQRGGMDADGFRRRLDRLGEPAGLIEQRLDDREPALGFDEAGFIEGPWRGAPGRLHRLGDRWAQLGHGDHLGFAAGRVFDQHRG